MPIPLLIYSDSPSGQTGLGRITRELALRIHSDLGDVFRVATIGSGSDGPSAELPFQQYGVRSVQGLVPENLPSVWRHFAGGERGTLMCILNPGWVPCIANPELLPDGQLRDFMRTDPFDKWLYAPIDGDTIGGRLPKEIGDVFAGFDRVLAYTQYGAGVIMRTMAYPDSMSVAPLIDHLPHGLDKSVFYPRNRKEARDTFVNRVAELGPAPLLDDIFMVGIVGTNTPRKDWVLAFETCAQLKSRGKKVGIWVHADRLQGFWNIPMLAREFGLDSVTVASNRRLDDEDMAWAYSAMDVTLGIGSGEGWGYCLAESLACGVPVIHGDYAGGAEFVPQSMLVEPVAYRGDGQYGIRRPVFHSEDWASAAIHQTTHPIEGRSWEPVTLPSYIDWNNAWPEWKAWLLRGLPNG